MPNVAAVVILYNPGMEVYNNISTYHDQIEKLYVVDNSENANFRLIEKIKLLSDIEYIGNNSNIGIAAALNIAAVRAINEGYKFLLTMDHDSKASPDMVARLVNIMETSDKIGIVAAEHIDPTIQQKQGTGKADVILFTMTSGNLVRLSAYEKSGGYLEKLFIDHVDHEFCLRLNRHGYNIIKASEAILYHKVGNASKKKFLNHYLYPTNHPPVRIYYRMRNRLYVDHLYKKDFPGYVRDDRRNMIREILEILLYDDYRIKKIMMIIKGFLHYKIKKLGKYKNAE